MTRTVFIVGNGPVSQDISDIVDGSDFVVRFNEPKVSIGMTGTKTDLLFVNNSDKPMQRRLNNPDYWTSDIVTNAQHIIFVYCHAVAEKYLNKTSWHRRLRGRKSNWTREAFEAYSAVGKYSRVLSEAEYEAGFADLGLKTGDARQIFPSTGYFGIRHVLKHVVTNDTEVNICGFSFEGWKKHSWSQEEAWLEEQRARFDFKIWS